jgi:hypothetical protein
MIQQLPSTWSEDASTQAPENAARFSELSTRLQELDERRRLARERVEMYKQLKTLVEPLGDIEGNIVVREGEIEQELEKMRLLMVRVQRGIDTVGTGGEAGEHEEGWDEEEGGVDERVVRILEGS